LFQRAVLFEAFASMYVKLRWPAALSSITKLFAVTAAGLACLGLSYAANAASADTRVVITWEGVTDGTFGRPVETRGGTISFSLPGRTGFGSVTGTRRTFTACPPPRPLNTTLLDFCSSLAPEWHDTFEFEGSSVVRSSGPGQVDLLFTQNEDDEGGEVLSLKIQAPLSSTFTNSMILRLSGGTGSLLADTDGLPRYLSETDLLFENLSLDRFDEARGNFSFSRSFLEFTITEFSAQVIRDTPPAPRTPSLAAMPAELISRNAAGAGGNGTSWDPTLSADATWLAYSSDATDLTEDHNGAVRDIFLKNRETGELINVTAGGNGDSSDPVLSKDGRWLAFVTRATNLATEVPDTNGAIDDIVLMEIATGTLTLATAGANARSSHPSLSRDGQKLVFDTLATNLGDSDYHPAGCTAAQTSDQPPCFTNIVLYERVTGLRRILSQGASSDAMNSRISEDGNHVAFISQAFDGSIQPDLVVMNLDTEERLSSKQGRDFSESRPVISASGRWVAAEGSTDDFKSLLIFDTLSSNIFPSSSPDSILWNDSRWSKFINYESI